MMQSMNGGKGTMSFTKNRAKLSNPEDKDKIAEACQCQRPRRYQN